MRALLAADGHHGADEPWLSAALARAAAGELLTGEQAARLAGPADPHARDRLQERLLADYHRRRVLEADAAHAALGWLDRRRTTPEAIAAGYDDTRLLICDHCRIVQDRAEVTGPEPMWGEPDTEACDLCGAGRLITYAHRDRIPTLADRLTQLRQHATG